MFPVFIKVKPIPRESKVAQKLKIPTYICTVPLKIQINASELTKRKKGDNQKIKRIVWVDVPQVGC